MAILTKLSFKQITYLFEITPKNLFEKTILKEVIYDGLKYRNQYVLCSEIELKTLIKRFNEYNLTVIGIQTNIDDDLPLYTFNVEDFRPEAINFNSNWIKIALYGLLKEYGRVWLRFYIDISDQQVEILMLKTGIPCI